MTVRSQVLIEHPSSTISYSGRFYSPAGYVTLVKSAYFYNSSTASMTIWLEASSADGSVAFPIQIITVAAGASAGWQGWFVLNPGDSVIVNNIGSGLWAWVSGAILNGPNQFPIAT